MAALEGGLGRPAGRPSLVRTGAPALPMRSDERIRTAFRPTQGLSILETLRVQDLLPVIPGSSGQSSNTLRVE